MPRIIGCLFGLGETITSIEGFLRAKAERSCLRKALGYAQCLVVSELPLGDRVIGRAHFMPLLLPAQSQ